MHINFVCNRVRFLLGGIVLVLVLAVGATSFAAEIDGLYTAEVTVAGKSGEDREAASTRALAAVVVKVTGSREVLEAPALKEAFERPSAYLQQYRYGTTMQPDAAGVMAPVPTLAVTFDQKAVNALLERASLPIWSRVRPAVLVWLAVEMSGQRTLLGPEDPGGLMEVARQIADERGVPLIVPLLDLEDRANLNVTDVWGGFASFIDRASARYGPEAVLVGRVAASASGAFSGRWRLRIDGAPIVWESTGVSTAAVVSEGLQGAADRLGLRFANAGGVPSRVRLQVRNIETLEDYARTSSYLEALDVVEELAVTAAKAATVSYELRVRGGRTALAQVIGLGRTLVQVPSDATLSTYTLNAR